LAQDHVAAVMQPVKSHWRGHLQRPLNRDATKDIVPPRLLSKEFTRNKTLSLNASSMAQYLSDNIRNDPLDNHTRPGGSLLRCQGQSIPIHRPWKDAIFDSKSGNWIKHDPRKNRQFKRTNSDISMVVTEPSRDGPPDIISDDTTHRIGSKGSAQSAQQFGSRPQTVPLDSANKKIASALGITGMGGAREEFLRSYASAAKSGGPPSSNGRLLRPSSAPSLRRS